MSDLELLKVNFRKGQLKEIEEVEVLFIVQITNLIQDLSVLQKLIYISSKLIDNDTEQMAQSFQALFFYRILTGILYEGWKIIIRKEYETVVRKYYCSFDDKAKNCFKEIERYFKKKGNLIKKVRNKFAYHYDFRRVRGSWRSLKDSEQLDMFIAKEHGNCRYTASDKIIAKAILDSTRKEDMESALETFISEIQRLVSMFVDFGGECILVFARRCPKIAEEKLVLKDVPSLDDLRLDYFVTL